MIYDCRLSCEHSLPEGSECLNLKSAFFNIKSSWGGPKPGSPGPDSLHKIVTFIFTCENEKCECKKRDADEDTIRVMAPEN
jgi:hypothetical protein